MYADSTAVVGPLAAFAEPHSYDLCEQHARGLTAPPSTDDLVALAEAVREAARPGGAPPDADYGALGRRGHLRVIPPRS